MLIQTWIKVMYCWLLWLVWHIRPGISIPHLSIPGKVASGRCYMFYYFYYFSLLAVVLNCFFCSTCNLKQKVLFAFTLDQFLVQVRTYFFFNLSLCLLLLLLITVISVIKSLIIMNITITIIIFIFTDFPVLLLCFCFRFWFFGVFFCFLFFLFCLKFSFYFWSNDSFSHMKRLRLVNYFVCLFCFFSWNHRLNIHNLILFIYFSRGLQFYSFIAILI